MHLQWLRGLCDVVLHDAYIDFHDHLLQLLIYRLPMPHPYGKMNKQVKPE